MAAGWREGAFVIYPLIMLPTEVGLRRYGLYEQYKSGYVRLPPNWVVFHA